jgi:hypothetical protein
MISSKIKSLIANNKKYGPVLFFMLGFLWDSLTLGRIDRLYDITILSTYLLSLSLSLYLINIADDGELAKTRLEKYAKYLPLAIQFFLGGLSSAYVIYFSRSVSLSKTAVFFLILVFLLFANELFKKRISNRYLQFAAYFFVSFTYFSFMVPVLLAKMNTFVFIFSGIISLGTTLSLLLFIFKRSPGFRKEINLSFMAGIILSIYTMINVFYYFNMIPPVPLALEKGMAAHDVQVNEGKYLVKYEPTEWYKIWRNHKKSYSRIAGENVYVFSSIFAPTALKKSISHRWTKHNPVTDLWEIMDVISFEITGGRDGGFRGYTYKSNVPDGEWNVEVITAEGLVLGVIDFKVITNTGENNPTLITKTF